MTSSARCPFCDAQPGQAVTATAAQAEAHHAHTVRDPSAVFTDDPCPVYDDGGHRNTEALVPASHFKCKCGYAYRGAARFA
jgi:hypothetical protein